MDENPRNIRWLLYALLVSIVFCAPAVAMYEWHGFPMQGNAADNAAFAYNGTVATGTVNGDVYIGCGHGLDGNGPMDNPAKDEPYIQAFNVPTGDVKFARMYVAVWHGTENYMGELKVDYTNASGTHTLYANGTDIQTGMLTLKGNNSDSGPDDNDNVWCTSHGVTWAWYDVKDYVTTGDNTATASTYKISSGFDGRVQSIKLIVVCENTSEPQVRYWINQGHDVLLYATSGYPAKDYGYSYFNGDITTSNWAYAMLYCTWYAGDQGDNDTLWFNGIELDDSCTNYEQGAYLDTRWYVVKNDTIDHLQSSGNYAKYYRDTDNYVHWIAADLVLFKVAPRPDLVVDSIDDPVLVDHDFTHGYVVGQDYTINATIMNQGKLPSGACQAALYEQNTSGRFLVDTANLGGIGAGGSFDTVTFDWHSYVNETVTLEVVADYLDAVNESEEGNNASTMNVNVLAVGQADLDMRDEDLALLPTWKSNDTTIRITVTNLGTDNANDFVVKAYNGTSLIYTTNPPMSVAAKGGKVISCTLDAPYGGPYSIRAVLDANGNVDEGLNEDNNETTKQLDVIRVMLWDSHHHGNTSTYNGEYSDDEDVVMFKVTKHVPKNTTPWDALHSVANVTPNPADPPGSTYVYGIDGLIESPSGPIYWYQYFNGRRVSNNYQSGVIKLRDGETMHWDFQKQIYTASDSFTPPCTAQSYPAGDDLHPEPFTHGFPMNLASGDGYSRTVWNTTVVYPSNDPGGEYAALADGIRDKLIAGGVPSGNVNVMTDTAVTTEKDTNNLILIGDMANNTLIVGVNDNASKIGMVAYFDTPGKLMVDDDNSTTPTRSQDCGGIIEAFDNPWNGNASFNEPGSIVLMATGVDDANAKAAADALVNYADCFDKIGFWPYTLAVPIHNDFNRIGIPLIRSTLDDVFGRTAMHLDKVYRFVSSVGYQVAAYSGGQWWDMMNPGVEPIEPGVGYEYQRNGPSFVLTVIGARPGGWTISTPIYEDLNLIGYANLSETTLYTFNAPAQQDTVCRFVPGVGPQVATYSGGQWWDMMNPGVQPITPEAGYEYQRVAGAGSFNWTYDM